MRVRAEIVPVQQAAASRAQAVGGSRGGSARSMLADLVVVELGSGGGAIEGKRYGNDCGCLNIGGRKRGI
jgi:hypothetical protein